MASTTSWEVFARGVTEIRGLASCKICTRLMFEPYVVRCGHAFCYGCLSQWLSRGQGRKCPDCRARIRDEPRPDYTIRNIVHILVSNSSFLEDGDTVESLQEEMAEQANILEKDRASSNGLFEGIFTTRGPGAPIHDAADGVLRCPGCNWELSGRYCENCDVDIDLDSLADFSDYISEDDYDSRDDFSDEPNEDDRAFIDDDLPVPFLPPPHAREDSPIEIGVHRRNFPFYFDRATSEVSVSGLSYGQSSVISENEEGSEISSTDDSDGDTTTNDGSRSGIETDTSSEPSTASELLPRRTQVANRRRPIVHQRGAAPRNAPGNSRNLPNRQNRHTVIDLTAEDASSPAVPRRRTNRSNTSNATAGPSNISGASRSQPESTVTNNADSDDEIPIPIRPRKRERIVLEDSDEEEEDAAVQIETRSRRRRTAR